MTQTTSDPIAELAQARERIAEAEKEQRRMEYEWHRRMKEEAIAAKIAQSQEWML